LSTKEHIVNLDTPPSDRWRFLSEYSQEINELIGCYLNDFSGEEEIFEGIAEYKREVISTDYLEEIEYIASISRFTPDQVLIANLYYDVLKFYFGCTAFAFESENGVLHARNLDWHTDNNLWGKHSMIFDFQKEGETVFKSVGWAGFIGVLSGMKKQRFSVTLNAVLSADSPEIATPISFFLRDVLTDSNSYLDAKYKLENTVIASDCLLLLSGMNEDELSVIERTPTRFATRYAENGHVIVTNDYKKLENVQLSDGVLQSTSCGRYDRANYLLTPEKPTTKERCLSILQDDSVMMGITVQQMVFNNRTGEIELVKTSGKSN
jgi:acid ceramidase